MSKKVFNPFIDFYGTHNISPVHQDISDLQVHLARREKLYRQLGIFPNAFKNKRVLEIGPGGGYNAIAFFAWGASLDFIEPNPKAQQELPELLSRFGVDNSMWNLYRDRIENANIVNKYDIIIAEGFLPGIVNQKEIINKISLLLNMGGVVSVTCVDEVSAFFEVIKRHIAFLLSREKKTFEEKVEILVKAFSSHLASLKGASRPIEDWVADNFLAPWIDGNLFSIEDCIKMFGDEFSVLGASPGIFNDYSWYKDTSKNINAEYLSQFQRKRHLLMITDMEESTNSIVYNNRLFDCAVELKDLTRHNENNYHHDNINNIIGKLIEMREICTQLDTRINSAIDDAVELLKDDVLNYEKVSNAEHLKCAFGKGSQYITMQKNFTDLSPKVKQD